jgi:hypothetical protein
MQDIKIKFLSGPLKGHVTELDELKGADTNVSRIHAQLIEQGGDIVVRNKSPNGTVINGKLTLDETVIKSGAKIGIGDQFELQLEWKTFGAETVIRKPKSTSPDALKKGPLASPVLRAVLAVYLGGILLVGLWVALSPDEGVAGDDWPALVASYEEYQKEEISADEWQARASRAEELVRELRALRTRDMEGDNMERICRELMSIDGDIKSPLYQYGARCLADR